VKGMPEATGGDGLGAGPGAGVDAWWAICSPRGTPGGVAIVQIMGDVAGALRVLGLRVPAVGGVVLIETEQVGEALLARWSETCLHLMPHGGPATIRRCAAWLRGAGLRDAEKCQGGLPGWDRAWWPEAQEEIEARVLWALSRAASPLAVDLLLAQPARWRAAGAEAVRDIERERALARLIEPPLVVALGGANIGKSTLANALAGRGVAIVADEAGTTRDHVGVMLEVDGLVLRYVDTPGLRETPDESEREAISLAMAAAQRADLVLRCGDGACQPPELPLAVGQRPWMTIGLRADLGPPCFAADVTVSLRTDEDRREGAARVARALRERLVPERALLDPAPWRFWAGAEEAG
jgi:hypothetical protein